MIKANDQLVQDRRPVVDGLGMLEPNVDRPACLPYLCKVCLFLWVIARSETRLCDLIDWIDKGLFLSGLYCG